MHNLGGGKTLPPPRHNQIKLAYPLSAKF